MTASAWMRSSSGTGEGDGDERKRERMARGVAAWGGGICARWNSSPVHCTSPEFRNGCSKDKKSLTSHSLLTITYSYVEFHSKKCIFECII